jgi:two-component system chemotaxis response regulator CheB
VDEALRLALRIIEERTTLSQKMAEDARRSGLKAAAAANERRAKEGREYAETLRRVLLGKGPDPGKSGKSAGS